MAFPYFGADGRPDYNHTLGAIAASRERVVILILVLGFVVVGVFGEKMGDIEWLSAATPGDFAFFAGAWLVAAHLFDFGLIILLAGLKNVPHFRSSALQHRSRLRYAKE